jgi:hypothetical protein
MVACEPAYTSVTRSEAHAILEPYVEEARRLFLEADLDVSATRFAIQDVHDSPRHFAACREDGGLIVAAPEMVELPEPTVVAILAHEFGHAVDFLHPGRYVLGREGAVSRDLETVSEEQRLRWLRAWQQRDNYVVEATADAIASAIYGAPIGYQGPCLLQSFRGGVPRPHHLR